MHFPLWTAPGVGICPQQPWELKASSTQHLRVELQEMLHCPAPTEEVCHPNHVPKILLQKYSPRQQSLQCKAAPLCAPEWLAQKGGRALFLVALPHTTDTAQPHHWLCYLSVHIKKSQYKGADPAFSCSWCAHPDLCNHRQHTALSSMLLTAPFFLNYFQLL